MYADEGLYVKPALLDKRGGHLYSEAAVSLAEAIYNDTGAHHVVNVRNGGALPFLEKEEVAEIPCVVGKNGAAPLPLSSPGTRHMREMIRTVKAYERYAVEAALTGDRDAALAALLTHPLIGDFEKVHDCFDALLEAHAAYLPQFFRGGNAR